MERTLILLKPDAVQRRLAGSLIQRFEQKGLKIAGLKLVQASRALAEKHYEVHRARPFFESLIQFLTGGPTIAIALEGPSAVAVARNLMGPTDGTKAPPGTIRGDHAISIQNNLVHGSDSVENANIELAIWFQPSELASYQSVDHSWVIG
ncbi:MAG: nucleoside-diphosphate kinase [Gemmataceae bacterium]|nr:nucleoside-diphosphate kinase [Gemmataceae bacterium]